MKPGESKASAIESKWLETDPVRAGAEGTGLPKEKALSQHGPVLATPNSQSHCGMVKTQMSTDDGDRPVSMSSCESSHHEVPSGAAGARLRHDVAETLATERRELVEPAQEEDTTMDTKNELKEDQRGPSPFLSFFSSSSPLAPSKVKIIPVWEFTPTAVTTIRPEPSMTWVPGKAKAE